MHIWLINERQKDNTLAKIWFLFGSLFCPSLPMDSFSFPMQAKAAAAIETYVYKF